MPTDDGTIYAGDVAVDLSTAGDVIIESFTINRPSQVIEQFDEDGEPLKQRIVPKFVTASGTIQYNGTAPVIGETFTLSSETWILDSVGMSYSASDYRKCPATFRLRINTPAP